MKEIIPKPDVIRLCRQREWWEFWRPKLITMATRTVESNDYDISVTHTPENETTYTFKIKS